MDREGTKVEGKTAARMHRAKWWQLPWRRRRADRQRPPSITPELSFSSYPTKCKGMVRTWEGGVRQSQAALSLVPEGIGDRVRVAWAPHGPDGNYEAQRDGNPCRCDTGRQPMARQGLEVMPSDSESPAHVCVCTCVCTRAYGAGAGRGSGHLSCVWAGDVTGGCVCTGREGCGGVLCAVVCKPANASWPSGHSAWGSPDGPLSLGRCAPGSGRAGTHCGPGLWQRTSWRRHAG